MSLWVKICGNTSLEDARLVFDAGADAAGFVFAPSPRRVTVQQVAAIVPHLPVELEKIGVFVDPDYARIAATVEACGLTGVQLHGAADPEAAGSEAADAKLAGKLRARFGAKLRILAVLHFNADAAAHLERISGDAALDGVLVDSRTATAPGGTGIAYDWQAARATLFDGQSSLRMIAAGGLHPGNVAEAIAMLQPWGVDVVTGVEAAPGRKDPEKVRDFVRHAREAAARDTAQSVH